jgi:hypothetical protein
MTKLSISALTMALLIRRSDASCPSTIELGSTCDLASLETAISTVENCTTATLFPGQVAADAVEELCEYDALNQFVEIQGTYQLDRRYMNGGGVTKDGENTFELDVARIKRFIANEMNNQIIDWPEYAQREDYNEQNDYGVNGYMTNFNIDRDAAKGSCQMNTAMCCFVEKHNDVVADNSDICRHDLSKSPQSNHVASGWSIYSGDEASHCVGFTWKDGDASDTYKGNALFYASLYQTATNGYMGNVPGAPMCACVEQMPVVTKADCVTASGSGLSFKFTVDDVTGDVSASHTVTMTYGSCGDNDLSAQVKELHVGTAIADDIDEYLIGGAGETCDESNADYLNDKQLLLPTATNEFANLDGLEYKGLEWKQLFGEGIYFLPPYRSELAEQGDAEVREALAQCGDRNCLILRKCTSCTVDSHKEIVYKRLTPFNPFQQGISTDTTMDIPNLFMNQWRKPNNVMHVDYELYSSVEDAIAGVNEWQQDDYNYNSNKYGFPRNSGPNYGQYIGNQWNSYEWGGGHANHHAFYIEVPATTTTV